MNVALIGMMGSMKSSVGAQLASLSGRRLIDTDELFVSETGTTVSEAFARCGEEFFRGKESEIIKRASLQSNVIISCGGGLPLRPDNRETLKENCFVIYLTAAPETIFDRIKHDASRPLLADENMSVSRIRAILEQRKPIYEGIADLTVKTDGRVPYDIAKEIMDKTQRILL